MSGYLGIKWPRRARMFSLTMHYLMYPFINSLVYLFIYLFFKQVFILSKSLWILKLESGHRGQSPFWDLLRYHSWSFSLNFRELKKGCWDSWKSTKTIHKNYSMYLRAKFGIFPHGKNDSMYLRAKFGIFPMESVFAMQSQRRGYLITSLRGKSNLEEHLENSH